MEKISVCENPNKKELESVSNDTYFRELPPECALKLSDENIYTMKSINKITRVDAELMH